MNLLFLKGVCFIISELFILWLLKYAEESTDFQGKRAIYVELFRCQCYLGIAAGVLLSVIAAFNLSVNAFIN